MKYARRLVSALPWWLRRSVNFARASYLSRRPPFEGVYDSFWDTEDSGKSWAASTSTSARAVISDAEVAARRSILATVAAQVPHSGALRILDFGGGAGIDFAALLATLPQTDNLRYTVVDLPDVCATGRELWAGDTRIDFSPELPAPASQFDLVYACTSLHYAGDYVSTLKCLADYGAPRVLLLRHAVAEKEFVRRQVNIPVPRPVWVMSEPRIREAMNAAGYGLAYRGVSDDGYNVDNYAPEQRVGRTVNMLFKRG
jgi:putative methyltransferase (TIGR04325 family)